MCLSSTDGRGVTLHEERACFLWLHTPPTGDAAHVWVSIVRLQSMTYRYSQSRLQRVRVLSIMLRVRTSALCDLLAACTSAPCFACSVYECTVCCLQHVRVRRVLLQRVRVRRVLLAACTSATMTVRAISAVVTRSCSSVSCTVCKSSRPRKSKLPLFYILRLSIDLFVTNHLSLHHRV